jgi:hypothetical protein
VQPRWQAMALPGVSECIGRTYREATPRRERRRPGRGPLEKAHARFEFPTYGQTASNEKIDVSTLLVSSNTSTDAGSPTVAATYSRATLL